MKHPTPCVWCGSYHAAKCPLVKAIEYFEDGVKVKKVEFFPPPLPEPRYYIGDPPPIGNVWSAQS